MMYKSDDYIFFIFSASANDGVTTTQMYLTKNKVVKSAIKYL